MNFLKKVFRKALSVVGLRFLIHDFKNIFQTPEMVYEEMDYDKYWEHRNPNNYSRPRFPIMSKMIKEGSSVVDIGCGDGAFLNYLKERKEVNELGVDISNSGIKRAKQKDIHAQIKRIDDFRSDEKFDYVIMSEVIEHVSNSEYFVKKGFDIADKALIITIPNSGYYTYRLRLLLLGKFPIQYVHHPAEHLRYWSIKDFKVWVKSLNIEYKNLRVIPSEGVPFLKKVLPNLFGNQIVYYLEKNNINSSRS